MGEKANPYSLTPKQLKAVDYYMKGYGKKQAGIAAGYSSNTAHTPFGLVKVKNEIERRRKKAEAKNEVDRERIREFLLAIIFADVTEGMVQDAPGVIKTDLEKLSPEARKRIQNIVGENKFRPQYPDKLKAIELYSKLFLSEEKKDESEDEVIVRLTAARGRLKAEDVSE